MSKQKILEDYFEVKIATSSSWKCHKCGEVITTGRVHMFMRRNRHTFILCGKCITFCASKAIELDPKIQEDCVPDLL